MALAVPYRKEMEPWGWREVSSAALGLIGALGLNKLWGLLIGLRQNRDNLASTQSQSAFATLQGELTRLTQRVTYLEEQAQRQREEHASIETQLRQEAATANGEVNRLTILTVQQAARIQELEAKAAERSRPEPEVMDIARGFAQRREADGPR